jgi:Holliday junction resolvasome RuvABC endonuclease subunit
VTKPYITLGIDSGTRVCGFALYVGGRIGDTFSTTYMGTYDQDKLAYIVNDIGSFLEKSNVDFVVIEEPAPVRGSRAITSLNQVAGAIVGVCVARGIEFHMLHNAKAKSALGVRTKAQAVEKIKEMYPQLENVSDDECDAVLMVEAYMKLYVKEQNEPAQKTNR